jgi:hypothetical protein
MLFNYKTAGYVAYEFSYFDTDRVFEAAVPAVGNHTGDPILQPTVTYQAVNSGEGIDPRGEIIHTIYTYESPAYDETDQLKGMAVVIGGKYNNSPTTTYYRVNLKTSDDASNNISSHILRNHRYDVEIQNVSGPGESIPIEAYVGYTNLVVKVLSWHDAELPDVTLSPQK